MAVRRRLVYRQSLAGRRTGAVRQTRIGAASQREDGGHAVLSDRWASESRRFLGLDRSVGRRRVKDVGLLFLPISRSLTPFTPCGYRLAQKKNFPFGKREEMTLYRADQANAPELLVC